VNTVEISLDICGLEHSLSAAAVIPVNPIDSHHYSFYYYSGHSALYDPEHQTVHSACIADSADCWSDYTGLYFDCSLFPDTGPCYGALV
jgi:hypothetical protein